MSYQNPTHIKSFILRAWNDEPDAQKPPRWRYVLLDTASAYRRGFTSLDQLFTTLSLEISGDTSAPCAHADIIREVEELLGIQFPPSFD
ncbi:MAG: hypothetical protein R3C14_42770 [Caldilineaceae bacterium]